MEFTKDFYVSEDKPWFKEEAGWPKEVPKNYDFPLMTLGQMLEKSAKEFADRYVMNFLDTYMTYKEFKRHVDGLATYLYHKLGIRKGDVVALLLPNSFQYVISYYASVSIGAIVTGINPTYKPQEALHQLKITGAKVLIVLDVLYKQIIEPILKDTKIKFIISTNIGDFLPPIKRFLGKLLKKLPTGEVPESALMFKDLVAETPNLPEVDVKPEDEATYIMTGGTTGVPKAAVLTHFNCVSNAIQSALWIYKVKPGSMAVGILPLFHSFAMTTVMNLSIYKGCWMLLFPKPPKMEEFIPKLVKYAPPEKAMFPGAEILFKRFAEFKDLHKYDVKDKLGLCVSGAGPLHRPVQEAFEKATGARLVEGYGLTEASPVVSASPFWGKRKIGTIGLPFPGTEWKIVDKDDPRKEMPIGEAGELAVAGPQVMKGYLNNPEATAETIIEIDGKRWLLTGDIGRMDEYGRVTIEDRKKQLIKYKGYSVFPTEVETLLMGNEAVREVAVAGLPDPETGEAIKAWIVLKDEYKGKVKEEDIIKWAKENLTHYKVPKYVEFVDELPKSLVGKVMRRILQENDPIYKKYKEQQQKK